MQSSLIPLSFFILLSLVFAFLYWDQSSVIYLALAVLICSLGFWLKKFFWFWIFCLVTSFFYFKSQITIGQINYGLSYILFFSLSAITHIVRKREHSKFDVRSAMAFAFYPPHLLAGPFLTYDQICSTDYKTLTASDSLKQKGVWLITWGLLVGLSMLYIEDLTQGYLNALGEHKIEILHLHMFKNLFYLYAHFSAWSNVAIGVSCLLGFQFPLNFDLPLLATQPSDFWRRWHTSLGNFFSQYVYFPILIQLGKCKFLESKARSKVLLSLILTWLLVALWHGIDIRYFIWAMGVAFSIFFFSVIPNKPHKIFIFFRWALHFYFLLLITSIFMNGEKFLKNFFIKDSRSYSQDLFWQTALVVLLVGIIPTFGDWALKKIKYQIENVSIRLSLLVFGWVIILFLFTHQGSPIYGQF